MANLEGMRSKFTVFKNEDLQELPDLYKHRLIAIEAKITTNRSIKGKDIRPDYLVINTDEPYAEEVIEIMKRHGDWG